ncbi:hypothetical protein D1007_62460 [Hordeum vulgare]|nr:hypothetical protein D1007_62460 [Hordeum vulgare]
MRWSASARALEKIAVRRPSREEGGVIVLDDNDMEMPAQTAPVYAGQGCSKDDGDDDDDNGHDYTAFYQLVDIN